ncbi:predicted protein [Postia placenta Mad-698-R]|nr:predicted protein [Postia placenta Mad-698-R]
MSESSALDPAFHIDLRIGGQSVNPNNSCKLSQCMPYEIGPLYERTTSTSRFSVQWEHYVPPAATVAARQQQCQSHNGSGRLQISVAADGRLGKRKADALDGGAHGGHASSSGKRDTIACTDYQTGAKLSDALSASLKAYYVSCTPSSPHPPHIQFHGAYTIIADPRIPQWKRVELVSNELRKVVRYPYSNKVCDRPMTTQSWTEFYQCDCSRGRALPPFSQPTTSTTPSPTSTSSSSAPLATTDTAPSSSSNPVKRTQSSLSHWIINTTKKSKAADPSDAGSGTPMNVDPLPGCGGKLHITAEEDNSHPLGPHIKGQKIVVMVEHPTNTAHI